MDHSLFSLNRRAFLGRYAGAIGTLALAHLLEYEQAQAAKKHEQCRSHRLERQS